MLNLMTIVNIIVIVTISIATIMVIHQDPTDIEMKEGVAGTAQIIEPQSKEASKFIVKSW